MEVSGALTNEGTLSLASSTVTVDDLLVSSVGFVRADFESTIRIKNDIKIEATDNNQWDTSSAKLIFDAAASQDIRHNFIVNGVDLGADYAGYANNYAWGSLSVDPLESIYFGLSDESNSGALYVKSLLGAVVNGNSISNLFGMNGLAIYYDPTAVGNEYLEGKAFMLANNGQLKPIGYHEPEPTATPEPGTMLLMGIGAAGVAFMRRRKMKNDN